ncbi:MAG: phenylalanine--tRNA ligase beta subunit-related protein [Nitrososphaerales archaeon]
MELRILPDLEESFPGLQALIANIRGVKVEKGSKELEELKEKIVKEVKEKYNIESLKDMQIFRAYRDFFWKVGIDPTKIRPAAEALIRRILGGKSIPNINNVVDAYNLASIKTGIALAAFDEDKIQGNLIMRFARKGERFLGIGMDKPKELQGREIVVSDDVKLIAIYPYRDADESKLNEKTKNILLIICGVPGISKEKLIDAKNIAIEYITKFCGGAEV